MNSENKQWLPHLSPEVVNQASAYHLDSFLVALEGWRRGLTLKWHMKNSEQFRLVGTWNIDQPGRHYSLSDGANLYCFFKTRGDLNSNTAAETEMDNISIKNSLMNHNVSTPKGFKLLESDFTSKELDEWLSDIKLPVVVKPYEGSIGRWSFTNLNSTHQIMNSIESIQNELQTNEIIIEEYIPGSEYRLYVVGEEVVGAVKRTPANIVGDGESTVEELINRKNELRSKNPRLKNCPIIIDSALETYLSKQNLTLESVIASGRTTHLSNNSDTSIGGDSISVTHILDKGVKEAAIKAVKSVNLKHGAVDLIVDEKSQNAVITELNATEQIGDLVFPMYGEPNDIPKAIIDYYFPETRNSQHNYHHYFYFDLHQSLKPLLERTASIVQVMSLHITGFHMKQFIIDEDIHDFEVNQQLKREAEYLNIKGYVKVDHKEVMVLAIANEEALLESFISNVKQHGIKVASGCDPEYEDYYAVKDGFQIYGERESLLNELEKLRRELPREENKNLKLEKQFENMLNSTTWKITRPFRLLGTLKKNMKS